MSNLCLYSSILPSNLLQSDRVSPRVFCMKKCIRKINSRTRNFHLSREPTDTILGKFRIDNFTRDSFKSEHTHANTMRSFSREVLGKRPAGFRRPTIPPHHPLFNVVLAKCYNHLSTEPGK